MKEVNKLRVIFRGVLDNLRRMLLKGGMGNGEWGMGNGEWGMRNSGQR